MPYELLMYNFVSMTYELVLYRSVSECKFQCHMNRSCTRGSKFLHDNPQFKSRLGESHSYESRIELNCEYSKV